MAKILADTEIRKKLEEIFRCSRKTVSEALNCRSDSDLARKIRVMAIKLGGSVKKEEHVTII
ncbi:hypothetical protein [Parabacteroides merdae]|uniref:hypothetical protein n=1 Tax=Parabacteroides merdae TaxID=46503 RepID=UPI0022E94698|nr:hypothetical protein [Parabacteroides merdae]